MYPDRRDVIAIPTFNRPRELIACITCLREARGLERFRIFVRDDASTAFGPELLRHLLPEAESIRRNERNLGTGDSQMLLLKECLDAGASRILVLDSDLIVSPAALDFAHDVFPRTDGVLGLYNSVLHRQTGEIDRDLIRKGSIGGAGTFWEAALLRTVVESYAGGIDWDFHASRVIATQGRRIAVSRRSYIQHLGIVGQNNGIFGDIEYGHGFVVETEAQARFMAAAFDTLMINQRAYMRPRPPRRKGLLASLGLSGRGRRR